MALSLPRIRIPTHDKILFFLPIRIIEKGNINPSKSVGNPPLCFQACLFLYKKEVKKKNDKRHKKNTYHKR